MSTTQTFRPDYISSEVVETGIALADHIGPASAESYLSHHGVLPEVIQRVITEPEHRRNPGRLRVRDERLIEEGSRANKYT